MIGMKSSTPNSRFQVFQSRDLMEVNSKPFVRGPAYTAGARAMKLDSEAPREGSIPLAVNKSSNELERYLLMKQIDTDPEYRTWWHCLESGQ